MMKFPRLCSTFENDDCINLNMWHRELLSQAPFCLSKVNEQYRRNEHPIPKLAGIYAFFDAEDYAIYVGQTVDLRRRIKAHIYVGKDNTGSYIKRIAETKKCNLCEVQEALIKNHSVRFLCGDDYSQLNSLSNRLRFEQFSTHKFTTQNEAAR